MAKLSVKDKFSQELSANREKSHELARKNSDILAKNTKRFFKNMWSIPVLAVLGVGFAVVELHLSETNAAVTSKAQKLSDDVASLNEKLDSLKTVDDVDKLKATQEANKKAIDTKLAELTAIQNEYRALDYSLSDWQSKDEALKKRFNALFSGNAQSVWVLKGKQWTFSFTAVDPYNYDTIRLFGRMLDEKGNQVGIYILKYDTKSKLFTEELRRYDITAMQNGAGSWMGQAFGGSAQD